MSYLKELLPIIAASGGTALLVEYEDMFPYEGILKNISSKTAYSKEQVRANLNKISSPSSIEKTAVL